MGAKCPKSLVQKIRLLDNVDNRYSDMYILDNQIVRQLDNVDNRYSNRYILDNQIVRQLDNVDNRYLYIGTYQKIRQCR